RTIGTSGRPAWGDAANHWDAGANHCGKKSLRWAHVVSFERNPQGITIAGRIAGATQRRSCV
ncbi:MAG TPA: hypothetical protein VF219_17840, partial [Vicinamibacterales bacterium]